MDPERGLKKTAVLCRDVCKGFHVCLKEYKSTKL